MPRVKNPNRKHLIVSNYEQGSNCDEDCKNSTTCSCDYVALEDERANLNREVDGRILAIAQLGLWNGTRSGYKLFSNNIRSILVSETPYSEWYSDGRNIKARMTHHDGTNHLEYRVVREDRNINTLLNKLYNNEEVTRQMINYYTKSLHPYVAKIYGW